MDHNIFDDERIDDLQYKGLKLIQKKSGFCFGVDAVLLSDFVDVRKNDKVLDMCSGTGIIGILIAAKTDASKVTGLEIQCGISDMAERSVRLNGLESKIDIVCGDLKNGIKLFGPSSYNVVVTNPPYMSRDGGLKNPSDTKAISRHEILCTLEDIVRVSARLLVPGGRFSMVHRPGRLADIICLMRSNGIEPKLLRMVHPSPYKKPNLVLIEGTRGGKPLLKVLGPLYVYDGNGNYSDEINRIYNRGEYSVDE